MRPPLPIARGLKRSRVLQRRGGFHPTSSSEGRKNIMTVTLLLSVGGAPGPIVYSIRQNQPECIIFFVSAASRRLVSDKILPQLLQDPGRLPDHEFIVTPDQQDLAVVSIPSRAVQVFLLRPSSQNGQILLHGGRRFGVQPSGRTDPCRLKPELQTGLDSHFSRAGRPCHGPSCTCCRISRGTDFEG